MINISLRTARILSGYTLKEAAVVVCISPSTLRKYELLARETPLTTAIKLSRVYGFPIDRITFI